MEARLNFVKFMARLRNVKSEDKPLETVSEIWVAASSIRSLYASPVLPEHTCLDLGSGVWIVQGTVENILERIGSAYSFSE